MNKSRLERPRAIQIAPTSIGVPTLNQATVQQWLSIPPPYETIVQRAETAQVRKQQNSSFQSFFFCLEFLN